MLQNHPNGLFGKNLSFLRRKLGLSQKELAEKIQVTRQSIFKYEKAEITPSMDVVLKLSKVFDVQVDFFFNERDEFTFFSELLDIKGISTINVKYREKLKLDDETDSLVKKEMFRKLFNILQLEKITKSKIQFKNPVKDIKIKNRNDAERAALEVRKKWGIYNNPIANVINLLEGKGIRVIEIRVAQSFEGLSAYFEDVPIIVLNLEVEEFTRRRFTSLHELAHLLLEMEGISEEKIEKLCDAFAGSFLMPAELLLLELGPHRERIYQRDLISIKDKFGISIQAILVGAAFANIISWTQYNRLMEENISSNTGNFNVCERSERIDKLVMYGLSNGYLDRAKAVELSDYSLEQIKNIEENYINA